MSEVRRTDEMLNEDAVELRLGTADDLGAVISLGAAMVDEFPRYRGMPFNEAKMTARSEAFFQRGGTLFLVAVTGDGDVVGFFTATLEEYDWADDLYAQEHLWYLVPDLRGGKVHAAMFEVFEHWAKINKCREIFNTMYLSPEKSDGMDQMMRRMGYRRMGGTYWKGLRHGVG